MQYWDLNPQPLEREPPPVTTSRQLWAGNDDEFRRRVFEKSCVS